MISTCIARDLGLTPSTRWPIHDHKISCPGDMCMIGMHQDEHTAYAYRIAIPPGFSSEVAIHTMGSWLQLTNDKVMIFYVGGYEFVD